MPYLTFNDVLEKAGITNLDRVLLIRHSLNNANFAKCYSDSKTGTCFSKHLLHAKAFNSKGNMTIGLSSSVQKALVQNCIAFIKSEIASNALRK